MTTCVLVADSGTARLFVSATGQQLSLLEEIANPEGRLTAAELNSDRAGVQRNDGGGSHGLGGDRNPHEVKSERFARTLCKRLHELHQAGHFDQLDLVAPPHFLGLLRRHLPEDCRAVLHRTLDKDLVRVDAATLAARLDSH